MGQTNWYANTSSYLLRADLFAKQDVKLTLKYAIEDFDDKKVAVQSDSRSVYIWYFKEKFFRIYQIYI